MIWFTSPRERNGFDDTFAWLPVRAVDDYSGRAALVWLTFVRRFDDGRVTFSSFWI